VLNNSQEKNLTLHQELEMIRLYVEMEQLRFNNRFQFHLQLNKNVNEFETIVPAMLIQPYIENAIWHGLMNLPKEQLGILNVSISLQDTLLKIVVEDNGIGRAKSLENKKLSGHQPVGMKLTEQRLLLINKMEQYENARVIVTDLCNEKQEPSGTRVEIFIPTDGN
jgi:LytS/YehU family sensor histidine kinase